MTAIQIVNQALEANKETSLYQMLQLRRLLNDIENIVTTEKMVEGWRKGKANIDHLIEQTEVMAKTGEAFRIM
jgi:hypothetical protein